MLIHNLEALAVNDLIGAKAFREKVSGSCEGFFSRGSKVRQICSIGIFDQGIPVADLEKVSSHTQSIRGW